MKKALALTLLLCLLLCVGALAAGNSYTDLTGVIWEYEDGALRHIQDGNQAVEKASALLISDSVNGMPVTAVTSDGFDNVVVGHTANQYILIPEGITSLSAKAFYDFNYVKAVSIPSSVTAIDYNAFDVLGRQINNATVIYGAKNSAAEAWAKDNSTAVYPFETVGGANFSVSSANGGFVYPAGRYYVPDSMKQEGVTVRFSVEAEAGYAIEALTADGKAVPEAAGKTEYLLSYTFGEDSAAVSVSFVPSGAATGSADDTQTLSVSVGKAETVALGAGLETVTLNPDAVAKGVNLDDVYDAPESVTSGYTASMGVSTADWYVLDGVQYQQVFAANGSGEHGDAGLVFRCKAELINYLYEAKGWVYGEDYDLLRLYHYAATVSGGNRKGSYDYHCAFAYKLSDAEPVGLAGSEAFYSETENTEGITNNGTLLVQGTDAVTVTGLDAQCYTRPDGPQEATNFYGLGSAVLVDGGSANLNAAYATGLFPTAALTLNDPQIIGGANPIYVLASARADINGGVLFTAFSGGHGPYASLQGQIVLNGSESIVGDDGTVNTDVAALRETALADIPQALGHAVRNTNPDGSAVAADDYSQVHATLSLDDTALGDYEAKNGDATVVVTANSSGSLLVTDSGGGIVVANKVCGEAYSTGSSGVYSMGGGSYIYVYNSSLTSHIEPALNSVGEGYIFGFNSRFTGPVGVLSSGGKDHVQLYNSCVTTQLDFDMDFYDLTDPTDLDQLAAYQKLIAEVESAELVNSNFLMIFPLNGDDMNNFVSNWYADKTQVPGKNGGNIAVLSTTSASGITVDSTRLENKAYAEYGDEGVGNWLIAAAGGSSVFNFRNENSRTEWDLTGADAGTTELYGNIYCAAPSGSGMWVTASGSAIVNLENSEWTGSIEDRGDGVTLNLDSSSAWTVTGTCAVKALHLEKGASVTASEGCTLTVYADGKEISLDAGDYEDLELVVTRDGEAVYDGIYALPEESADIAGQDASDEQSGEMNGAASGEAGGGEPGSGEMASGEGPGGGAAGTCDHDPLITGLALDYDADALDVRQNGAELEIKANAAGEHTLICTLSLSDGTTQTKTLIIRAG